MAGNIYVKSIILLVSLGGIGYGLMQLTTPSAEKIERIKQSTSKSNILRTEQQNALMLKRLQAAATESSIYTKPDKKQD